jgi:hypothetical protein
MALDRIFWEQLAADLNLKPLDLMGGVVSQMIRATNPSQRTPEIIKLFVARKGSITSEIFVKGDKYTFHFG